MLNQIDSGHDVVMVVHSWAGLPVSSALDGLSKRERVSGGKENGVVRMIYISAFLPPVGVSLLDALSGKQPDWWRVEASSLNVTLILA